MRLSTLLHIAKKYVVAKVTVIKMAESTCTVYMFVARLRLTTTSLRPKSDTSNTSMRCERNCELRVAHQHVCETVDAGWFSDPLDAMTSGGKTGL